MGGLTLEKAYDRVHQLRTVLVVEDDADILSSVAEVLREDGFDVYTASNGHQALAEVRSRELDLILLDLMMPQMDGWSFVHRLRMQALTRRAPIVLLSAVSALAETAAELEVDGYLAKPFSLEDVVGLAHRICD
jgi:DNA-binding response OmpR family regulator